MRYWWLNQDKTKQTIEKSSARSQHDQNIHVGLPYSQCCKGISVKVITYSKLHRYRQEKEYPVQIKINSRNKFFQIVDMCEVKQMHWHVIADYGRTKN